jgi:hypothetical protein
VVVTKYTKFQIASRQLETAIGLFVSGRDRLSAISLAGAADGILHALVLKSGRETIGVGLQGGMLNRKITVLFDKNYHFDQNSMEIPNDLYAIDRDTAFTCSAGEWASPGQWSHTPRRTTGYRLVNGELTVFEDVQQAAQIKYDLKSNEVFLGFLNNTVFFWRDFNPKFVFWRQLGSPQTFRIELPNGIIEIYGAAKGIKQDVGFMVFRKTPGLIHWYPRTWGFVEIQLSKGKIVGAP